MKTRVIVPTLLLAALPAAGGCNGGNDLTTAVNAFSVDIYQALRGEDGNLFLSPASISYALGMTRTGAGGTTMREMDEVLHLTGAAAPAAAYGRLMQELNAADAAYTLRLANRLYGQTGLEFRPEFLTTVDTHFDGGLAQVDFKQDAEAARGKINAWVCERTAERIPELLASGTVHDRTRLVLVNAIYFLGDWQTVFPAEATRPRDFQLLVGNTTAVPMMNNAGSYGYAAPDGLQILSLPYRGGELEMVVLLPEPEIGLAGLEERFTAANLAAWVAAPTRTRVAVTLPKFAFTAEFQLARTLAGMGMPLAFSDEADFSGMVAGGGLAIDDVIHKAYVRVDEEGTEAAAATGVTMRLTGMPPTPEATFVADRPFLFLIRHKPSGALLFLGRMTDPRS